MTSPDAQKPQNHADLSPKGDLPCHHGNAFFLVGKNSTRTPVMISPPHALRFTMLLAITLSASLPIHAQDKGSATPEYQAAMDAMMSGMMIPYSGNADVDFIKGMIPHHQGAVDNARIVLKYGQDPEVRKFAQTVIDAQQAEITWMKDWLARNGG
jgi:Domain of unknown function (DUF305)